MTFKWLVFLIIVAGVALWWLMFAFFLRGGWLIYRTGHYFYKDLKPWLDRLKQSGEDAQAAAARIGERGSNLSAMGQELKASLEEIADVADEIRSHPYVKTARLAGRLLPD